MFKHLLKVDRIELRPENLCQIMHQHEFVDRLGAARFAWCISMDTETYPVRQPGPSARSRNQKAEAEAASSPST